MTEYNLPVNKQGKYLIIDTTLTSDQGIFFDEMSGDKGDAGRKVYLAIKERSRSNDPKDPLIPMDLQGKDVRFQGYDADGKWKRIALSTKIENAKAGLAEITLPRAIYQAVGRYQSGEFEIFETAGDSVISTVPVVFEVFDNGVHLTAGESKNFSDEFNALLEEYEKLSKQSIDNLNNDIDEANRNAGSIVRAMESAKTEMDAWKLKVTQLIASWETMLKESGAVMTTGDHVVRGQITALETILGYTTGHAVKFIGKDDAPVDLNDGRTLQDMPPFTTKHEYFSMNSVLNSPVSSGMFDLETVKVSTMSGYQRIREIDNSGRGVIKIRRIYDLETIPKFSPWMTESRFSPLTTIVPYLTDDFKSYYADGSLPMYQLDGNSVHLRGQISPTRKFTPESRDAKILIAKNLPFNAQTSQRIPQIWSGAQPYTLRLEGKELWMERIFSPDGTIMELSTGQMFTFGATFLLNEKY